MNIMKKTKITAVLTLTLTLLALASGTSVIQAFTLQQKQAGTAKNGGVHFRSNNHYKNSNITLVSEDKDYLIYQKPNYPSCFTKTDKGFKYKNGTKANKIKVTLTGYTSVDFND